MRVVPAGPLTGLIAQVLLLAALDGTFGLSADAWIVGLIFAVIIDAALAHGLSRSRSGGLSAFSSWRKTLTRWCPR